ncbi:MAG: DUF6562 domain-containing protein [Bacteroidales bacterium]|nr:DUF6562 domain-containing protein [Bacteroidales bacterium]
MKKLLYCAAALSAVLFAGSCQRENLEPVVNGGVTYTITLPETVQTKGENGYAEYDLYYEVYKTLDPTATGVQLLFQNNEPIVMTDETYELTLDLLNDQDYTVLFWANKKGTAYFNTEDLRNVAILAANSNDDDRDAFCGMDQLEKHDGAQAKTVELKRPFAQVNIATLVNEVDYNIHPQTSYVKFTKIPVAYNVFTGKPVGETAEVEYGVENDEHIYTTIPADSIDVNGVKYKYVAMNYVLVPEANIDVYYEIVTANGTVSNTINNVPVKKNYRTNIVGNLLTSNATYTVELKPGFEEGEYNGPEFVMEPKYNAETKTYTVTEAFELKWIAQQVNTGKDNFQGKTVQLAADIDLKNEPWTPIGQGNHFQGTFEGVALTKAGNDYPTISNLYIENGEYAGLFGTISHGAILRNFNLNHVRISGTDYLGAVVGQIYTTVENVTVEDAEITAVPYLLADGVTYDGGAKVGGIAGLVGQSATITDCTVNDATFQAYRDMGGIVGTTQNNYPTTLTGNTVDDLTFVVTSDFTPYNGGDAPGHYDPIRGGKRKNANDVIENNTVGEVTVENHATVSDNDSFTEALKKENAVVNVPAETEVELPAALNPAGYTDGTVTIVGAGESSVVNGVVSGNVNAPGNYANNLHLVFENLTYVTGNSGYNGGFGHAKSVTFINCKIVGQMYAHSNAPHYFYDCTIDPLTGYLYTYSSDCVFERCTFEASEGKALQVYADANTGEFNVTIKDCDFVAAKPATTWDGKPVTGIDINSVGAIFNVTIEDCTTSGFPTGLNSNSDLYNIKDGGIGKVNLVIDGVQVTRAGYTQLAGYSNLWTKDGQYYIYDLAGLQDFYAFLKANTGRHPYDRVYNIMNDIDADGWVWNSINVINGAGDAKGLVLNGNGKTISNLAIAGEGMFTSASAGAVIKNITMDGATVTSISHNAAIFWGSVYSSVSFENVAVKNSTINGYCNTGAFVGGTYEPNNLVVTFTNCSVENSALTAAGYEWQDPTGASGFLGKAFGSTKVVFNGVNTIDNATTITNQSGLVGGKVYGYTTWVDGGFAATGACDEFSNFGGVEVVKVGTDVYGNFTAAVKAAKAGDTISLVTDVTLTEELMIPAGVILNGNGKQINGSIYAGGDLTFAGHTKVTGFSASYYNHTINIEQGACLEVTGGDRVTFAYGNVFNITGSLSDAKEVDKTTAQPSMIIPGGISITGGNDFTMNLKDAYVQIGNTSSKNNNANGTFTLNIENSIAEFTNQLTFSEPTGGKNPTFNLNVKNSVLTTAAKFCIAAPNTNVVIDNSTVTLGTYLRNSGNLTLKNGSVLTGYTSQFGENGGNNGIINLDNSEMTITATSTGHAFDGKGKGKINLENKAKASVTYYKDMTITFDATSTFTGTEVQ